jgi:hypothetical protein
MLGEDCSSLSKSVTSTSNSACLLILVLGPKGLALVMIALETGSMGKGPLMTDVGDAMMDWMACAKVMVLLSDSRRHQAVAYELIHW